MDTTALKCGAGEVRLTVSGVPTSDGESDESLAKVEAVCGTCCLSGPVLTLAVTFKPEEVTLLSM